MADKEPVEQPQGNAKVLALAMISRVFCFAIWGLYSPLGPYIREDFHLTETQMGLLVSIPALMGGLMRIPMGVFTDLYGGRKVYTYLMVFVFFATMIGYFAHSYFMLLFAGFLFGMAGTAFIVGITHVSRWYPQEKQGLILGLFCTAHAGTAMATLSIPRYIKYYLHGEWHNVFPTFAAPLLIMSLIYWNYTSDSPVKIKPPAMRDVLKLARIPLALTFCLFYWTTFGSLVCFSFYLPAYLVKVYNIDTVHAADIATVFIFIGTLIRTPGGYLADKTNPRKILLAVFIVVAACSIILGMRPSITVATWTFYIIGACCGIGNGTVFKIVPYYFPAETGAVGGLVSCSGALGGFFMPIVLGFSKDYTGSYFTAFAIAAFICLMGIFFARKEFKRTE